MDNYYVINLLFSCHQLSPPFSFLKTSIWHTTGSTQASLSSWCKLMSLCISQAFQFFDHLIFINLYRHLTLSIHSQSDVVTLNFEIFIPKIPLITALSFDLKEFFKNLIDPFLSTSFQENLRFCVDLFSHTFVNSQIFWPCCLSDLPGNLTFLFSVPNAGPVTFYLPLSNLIWISMLPGISSDFFKFFHFHQIFKHNNLAMRPRRWALFFAEKIEAFFVAKSSMYYHQIYEINCILESFLSCFSFVAIRCLPCTQGTFHISLLSHSLLTPSYFHLNILNLCLKIKIECKKSFFFYP